MISIALAGCVGAISPPPRETLGSARQACNRQYPRGIGNYLPHAVCVNEAVERLAAPAARYPDLVRLQEDARVSLSDKIDTRELSIRSGERKMQQVDALIAQASHERDTGNDGSADHHIATIDRIMRE